MSKKKDTGSVISYNAGKVIATGQITKLETFESKGGGLTIKIQLQDDPDVAAAIVKNRGNITQFTMEFSSARAVTPGDDEGPELEGLEDE